MTDREQAFLDRWRTDSDDYFAWGQVVAKRVYELVAPKISPVSIDLFMRIPTVPRLKTEESLLQKAFFRGKQYDDPYRDIEDKVGVRFVVLVSTDIRIIEAAILEGEETWSAEKARDFLSEQEQKPYEFDYQSLHYVVRSKVGNTFADRVIPADLPCEIQVRTLLQHAYSELTHDTLYKPKFSATPAMKRAAAKSMALIEATDDYFRQLTGVIEDNEKWQRELNSVLDVFYLDRIGQKAEGGPLQQTIVDHYRAVSGDATPEEITAFINSKPFLLDVVKERRATSILFRVSSIFLIYYCISRWQNAAKQESPLTDAELEPLYSDLGFSVQG